MYRSFVYFVPALLWALLICALSSNTPVEDSPFDWLAVFRIDKIGHFVFYAILCLAIYWGLFKARHSSEKNLTLDAWIAFTLATAYGISMELFQLYYWEGRQFEYLDMIANTLGALLGVYIFKKYKNILPWTSAYQE